MSIPHCVPSHTKRDRGIDCLQRMVLSVKKPIFAYIRYICKSLLSERSEF